MPNPYRSSAARPRLFLRGLASLASLLPLACGPAEPPVSAGAEAPAGPCAELRWNGAPPRNVVVVVSDTMRRDRMSAYGGPAQTLAFDRLGREHLLFLRASTQAPWTKPAVATLFTGLYPSQHGALSHPDVREPALRGGVLEVDLLADEHLTLAERFRTAGWRTGAFVANPWLGSRYGFAQGFERYDDSFAAGQAPAEQLAEAALEWVGRGTDPFFLYLHAMDAHSPYGRLRPADLEAARGHIAADRRPLDPVGRALVRGLVRFEDGSPVLGPEDEPTRTHLELGYDRGVENFDRGLGRLLQGLRGLSSWDATAVVVTSDHGEALYERGWIDHGYAFFENETGLPLSARLPGVAADGPVRCTVGLVDLVATLCTYADLRCEDGGGSGLSWLAAPEGVREPRYLLAEGIRNEPTHRSVRNDHYKLVFEPEGRPGDGSRRSPYALYDLREDPAESRDLLAPAQRSDAAERIFRALSAALREVTDAREAPRAPLDEDTRRRLEELGYLE